MTGAEEEKTILGKLYVAGIGPGSLDGMTKEEADELSSLLKRVRHNLEKNL